jgi:hypothetical protein
MIRKILSEYFCFTRRERNGTMVLAVIMLAAFVYPYLYGYFFLKPVIYDPDPALLSEIRLFYGSGRGNMHIPVTLSDPGFEGSLQENSAPGSVAALKIKTDLNSADTLDLVQIKGIGPVFSRRILRYRDILGGYVDIEQLKEVYGIDEERYRQISAFLFANADDIKFLDPATDSFGVLLRHPYLDYDQVLDIFQMRKSGRLKSPEDLLQSSFFSEHDLERLKPYLLFE